MDTSKVTRVEVIKHSPYEHQAPRESGRVFIFNPQDIQSDPPKVTLQLQDDGQTLEVFIQ